MHIYNLEDFETFSDIIAVRSDVDYYFKFSVYDHKIIQKLFSEDNVDISIGLNGTKLHIMKQKNPYSIQLLSNIPTGFFVTSKEISAQLIEELVVQKKLTLI